MNPVSFARLASVCIILALPSAVSAQSRIRPITASVSGGLAYQSDSQNSELSHVGPVVSAQLRRRLGAWFAVRGLASVARFGEVQIDFASAPCSGGDSCPRPEGPMTVLGVNASLIVRVEEDTAASRGPYYIFGGSAYRPLEHPAGIASVRAGLSAGIGADFEMLGLPWQFEARLERLPQFDRGIWKVLPITLGVAW